MPTFAILSGLPGSGKSTLSRRLKADRQFFVVSTDRLRLALNMGMRVRWGGIRRTARPVVELFFRTMFAEPDPVSEGRLPLTVS